MSEADNRRNELRRKQALSIENHLCPDCRGKNYVSDTGCVKCDVDHRRRLLEATGKLEVELRKKLHTANMKLLVADKLAARVKMVLRGVAESVELHGLVDLYEKGAG